MSGADSGSSVVCESAAFSCAEAESAASLAPSSRSVVDGEVLPFHSNWFASKNE